MDGTNNVENSSSDVDCALSTLSAASSREELLWDNYSPPLHSCANGCNFLVHGRLSFQCASCGRPTSCSSCASSVSVKCIDAQQVPPGNGPLASEGNPVSETNASAGSGDDESPKTEESKDPSKNNNSNRNNTAAKRRHSDTNYVQNNNNNTESSNTTSSLSLDFSRLRWDCDCDCEDSTTSIASSSLVDGGVPLLSCLRFSDTVTSIPSTSMSEGRYQVMSSLDRWGTPPPSRSRSVDAVRRRTCLDGASSAAVKRNSSANACIRFTQTLKTRYKDNKYNCLSILRARECDDSSSSSENGVRSYVMLCSGSDARFFEDFVPVDSSTEAAASKEWRIDCNRPEKDPRRTRNLESRTKNYRCRPFVDVDKLFRRNQRVRWCDRCGDDDALESSSLQKGRRSSSSRLMTDRSEGRQGRECLGGLGSDNGRDSYNVVTDSSLTSSDDVDLRCSFVENDCSRFGRQLYYDVDAAAEGFASDDCECRFVRFSESEIDFCEECEEEEQEILFADEFGIEIKVLSCEYPEFIPPLEYLLGKARLSIEGEFEKTRPSSRMLSVNPISEQELENKIASGKVSLIRPTNELEVDETFEPGLVAPLQGKRKSSHVSTQLAPTLNVLPRPSSLADRSVKFSTADLSKVVNELNKATFLRALIENFPVMRKTTLLKTSDSRDFRSIEPYFTKQSKGIRYQTVMYAYDTAATGTHRLFGMGSQEKLAAGGQMVPDQSNAIDSIVAAYPLTTEVGLPMSFSADAVRESVRPSAGVRDRPSAFREGVDDSTSKTSVVRLDKRKNSNPFGLTITQFAPHHEQFMVTAKEDESSAEPSFNRVDAVPAVEDLDIPVQSFTDASRYKTSSSNRYAPPREPSIKVAKKSDSNLKCLKELIAAATSAQRSPSTTTTTTSSINRYSDDVGGGIDGGLSDTLLEPLLGQIDDLLKNSSSHHKHPCSSVTQVMSRPATKTPFVVCGGGSDRCGSSVRQETTDCAARRGSRGGRSWLRFLSARTIYDRSNLCDESSRPELHGYSMESTPEGGGGCHYPDITWVDRYNPPQSIFCDEPGSQDDCPCKTNREDRGTESITTIYSRIPASIQRRSTLPDDATLPPTMSSCIPDRFYSYRPKPKPCSAKRSGGRQKSRNVEFAASCKPCDDIISSTVIASRKRHLKREKCHDDDDNTDTRSKIKDFERKYKTLKYYCIKEFGRTRSQFDSLKPGDK